MNQDHIVLIIVAIVVNCLILYLVIQSATKAGAQVRNQQAMIALLIQLCKKQGVTSEEINEIGRKFS